MLYVTIIIFYAQVFPNLANLYFFNLDLWCFYLFIYLFIFEGEGHQNNYYLLRIFSFSSIIQWPKLTYILTAPDLGRHVSKNTCRFLDWNQDLPAGPCNVCKNINLHSYFNFKFCILQFSSFIIYYYSQLKNIALCFHTKNINS